MSEELFGRDYSDADPPPPKEWEEEIPPPEVEPEGAPIGDTGLTLADVMEETREVKRREAALSIPRMIELDPEKALRQVQALTQILPTLQRAAIAATLPSDWVVMKAKGQSDEDATAFPRKPACLQFRRFFGVSIRNPRNIDTGKPECRVTEYEGVKSVWSDRDRKKVPTKVRARRAEIWVDAYSDRLADGIEAVRGVRSSTEEFIGRATEPQDLEEAARTSADNKATRILCGIVSKPVGELAGIMGLTVAQFIAKASTGSGFGTSEQRETARQEQGGHATSGPVSSHAGEFWSVVVEAFGGNEQSAWAYLAEMAAFDGDKGKVKPKSFDHLAGNNGWYRRTVEKWNTQHPDHAFKGGE